MARPGCNIASIPQLPIPTARRRAQQEEGQLLTRVSEHQAVPILRAQTLSQRASQHRQGEDRGVLGLPHPRQRKTRSGDGKRAFPDVGEGPAHTALKAEGRQDAPLPT